MLGAENKTPLGTLPYDLAEPILTYLFRSYIKSRDYEPALQLCTTSRYFLRLFYKLIYRDDDLLVKDSYKRLARTFVFAESIDDYLVSEKIGRLNCCLRVVRPGYSYMVTPIRPWHFGKYTCREAMTTSFFRDENEMQHFNAGPMVGDIVWINGTTRNGVMHADEFYHPVINIILSDCADNVLPTAIGLEKNLYMKQFTKLLYYVYGSEAIVNFMVKDLEDDNPFIVTTDSFISVF